MSHWCRIVFSDGVRRDFEVDRVIDEKGGACLKAYKSGHTVAIFRREDVATWRRLTAEESVDRIPASNESLR